MISQEEIEGFLWPNDGEILNERPIQNDVLTLKEASTSGNEKIIRPEDVLYAQVGTPPITPTPSTDHNDIILKRALERYNNKIISYSYGSASTWNFSPCVLHYGYIDMVILIGKYGDFYKKMKRYYSDRGYYLENKWPHNNGIPEGIIYKDDQTTNKCNVFVFDTLEMAGLCPPLFGNSTMPKNYRYAIPEGLNYLCGIGYLKKIQRNQIKPGDIFLDLDEENPRVLRRTHMAIVTEVNRLGHVKVIHWYYNEQISFKIYYDISKYYFYRVIADTRKWCNIANRYPAG